MKNIPNYSNNSLRVSIAPRVLVSRDFCNTLFVTLQQISIAIKYRKEKNFRKSRWYVNFLLARLLSRLFLPAKKNHWYASTNFKSRYWKSSAVRIKTRIVISTFRCYFNFLFLLTNNKTAKRRSCKKSSSAFSCMKFNYHVLVLLISARALPFATYAD